ncbi:putative 3-phenylpropionic acid transporter [Paraburkholderia nemoris]|nr:putative 3-phenylpropionic acid transporter [Paraburkholderia nemoris]
MLRTRLISQWRTDIALPADCYVICIFYLLLYLAQGIIVPYFPGWLNAKGLSVQEVGYLLSVTYSLKVVGNPLVSHVADVTGRLKLVLAALALISTATYSLYLLFEGRALVFFVAVMLSLFMPAMYPMMDRLAVEAGTQRGFRFGRLRLWGSLGFAMGTCLAGRFLIPNFGIGVVVDAVLSILLCTSVIALNLPDFRSTRCKMSRVPVFKLLKRPDYFYVMLAAAFVQSSNGFLYSFSSLFWEKHGVSTGAISIFWGVGISCEMLMFFFGAPFLARHRVLSMQGVAVLGSAVRWGGLR